MNPEEEKAQDFPESPNKLKEEEVFGMWNTLGLSEGQEDPYSEKRKPLTNGYYLYH